MSDENFETEINEEAPDPVNAKVIIAVSGDEMQATMAFIAPENGGEHVSEDTVKTALKEYQIVRGVDWDTIRGMISPPTYNSKFIAAAGKPAVDGRDSELKYLIELKRSLKPKVREDGSFDHHELGIINSVKKDQTLIEKIPATTEVDGYTVRNRTLKAVKGKDTTIFGGQNTQVTEDRLKLIAAKGGHVEYVNERICVYDVFTLKSDVSNETGNIKFDGSVVINGNVLKGFTVEVGENITIKGGCEAANIIAGGNINISEGVNGGKISADGDIKCKFIQMCEVRAGKNIHANAIVNCNVHCGSSVFVSGGTRAAFMGGSCIAGESLQTMYIGSPSGKTRVVSRIEVGTDPNVTIRIKAATTELEQIKKTIDELDKIVNFLGQFIESDRLDDAKRQKYEMARYTKEHQTRHMLEVEHEIRTLKAKLEESGYGSIIARNGISEGTRLVIGPYSMMVDNSMGGAKIVRGEEGIVRLPLY